MRALCAHYHDSSYSDCIPSRSVQQHYGNLTENQYEVIGDGKKHQRQKCFS